MIQRSVPRELQGRAFSNFYGAIGLSAGLAYLLGGVLLQTVGPRGTFVFAGVGGILTAFATATRLRPHREERDASSSGSSSCSPSSCSSLDSPP